ncbi:MAG TPA: NADH-quinone oxidoreductase subunit K [Pedomonas sp.]|uniref:sodium:proton antiporter n=1 Tax=Pedomonas sp. TaxID=2976421 RepID=UPI002F42C2E1
MTGHSLIYAIAGALMVGIGLRALFLQAHLLTKIIAANVTASGTFLVLVGVAPFNGGAHPDPVPQAMVLTGIVISVSITAYALALLRRLYDVTGATDLPEERRK